MTTEAQREQEERRATLLNDARLREQQRGATYSSFADAFADEDRGGRFKTINQPIHTAATPVYPEQPPTSPFHHDPVPDEPPLGFSVNELQPTGEPHEIAASIAAQDVQTLERLPPFSSAQGNSDDPSRPPSNPLSPDLMPSSGSSSFSKEEE
jgi:hypothetical protein